MSRSNSSREENGKGKGDGLQKGLISQWGITPTQAEILCYYAYDKLSVKQIAARRGTSTQAVYKTLQKLREKDIPIDRLKKGGLQEGGYYSTPRQFTQGEQQAKKRYRLHAQRFKIKAPARSPKYEAARRKADSIPIKGNKINLHKKSIEVVARKDLSFYGDTPSEALNASIPYWDHIWSLLENDLDLLIVKDRKHAIKRTLAHYAKVDDRMAEKGIDEENIYRIKTSDDGKTWLIFDRSKGPAERETVHSDTAHDDSEWLDEHLNDIRDDFYHGSGEVPKLSEIKKVIRDLANDHRKTEALLKETAAGLSSIVDLLKAQQPEVPKQKRGFKPEYVG